MLFIIIGAIIIVAGFVLSGQENQNARFGCYVRIAGVIVIALGAMLSMFKTIDAGQVGVKTLFGKVDDDVLYSGLHVVNPLIEITPFDVKTQNYTMSAVHDEGIKSGDDAIRILSADGLEVTIDLSVLFKVHASQAPEILRQIGDDYLDKIVRPVSRTAIRDNAVSYEAIALYYDL